MRLPHIIQVSPKVDIVLIRDTEGRREGHAKREAEDGVRQPQPEECPEPPEAGSHRKQVATGSR